MAAKKIKVKPAEGRLVLHPLSNMPLSKDGDWVQETSFWVRRVKAGDVLVLEEG